VVSKAPISPPKKGGLNGHDSNHQTWGSHVWNWIFFPSQNWDLVYLTV
jgi:hypothetical protein